MRLSSLSLFALAISCTSPPARAPAPVTAAPVAADAGPADALPVDAAPAEDATVADAGAPVTMIVPCADGSAEHRDAIARFNLADKALESLAPTADPKPAATQLAALVAHPCLTIARHLGNVPTLAGASSPALVDFWASGGKLWLRSEINRATRRDHILVPPIRSTLALEANKASPLAALLCSARDAGCAASSHGWALRARIVFDKASREPVSAPPGDKPVDCVTEASEVAPSMRFNRWHSCVDSRRERRESLPLWLPKAPKKGWLIVRGRRGHYRFCDEVRLYNLASGATYTIQSCSGLVLGSGGRVDQGATDARRGRVFQRGAVNVENLRETAWMLMLLGSVEKIAPVEYKTVPDGMKIAIPDQIGFLSGGMFGEFMSSSAQTTLYWRIIGSEVAEIAGTVRWPADYNSVAATHAVDLLRVTEAGFVDGCPKKKPPALTAKTKGSGVSGVDADPARLALLQSDLLKDLRTRATKRCTRRKRAGQ